jgi:hypothetical protein
VLFIGFAAPEYGPEKWIPVSEKIMLNAQAKAKGRLKANSL